MPISSLDFNPEIVLILKKIGRIFFLFFWQNQSEIEWLDLILHNFLKMETNLSWKHQSGPAILKLYSSHGSARELGIISTKRGCHGVRHTCLHRSQKILWHYGFSCIFLEHLSPDHLVSFHCTVVYYNHTTVWQNYKRILHSNFIQWLVFSTDALHCYWLKD